MNEETSPVQGYGRPSLNLSKNKKESSIYKLIKIKTQTNNKITQEVLLKNLRLKKVMVRIDKNLRTILFLFQMFHFSKRNGLMRVKKDAKHG